MNWSGDGRHCRVRLGITGGSGSGRGEILRAVASRHGAPAVAERSFGGSRVLSCAWSDPRILGRRRSLDVRVLTIEGEEPYDATGQLLVRWLDAMLCVIDVSPRRVGGAWESLMRVYRQTLASNYRPREIPLVLQYHRADRNPGFVPGTLDRELGLPQAPVPRFVTPSRAPDVPGAAFDTLLGLLVDRILGREAA